MHCQQNTYLRPLPSPASLPGSLGGLPRKAEGLEGGTNKASIKRGDFVKTKSGGTFRVLSISKKGVVKLGFPDVGFAMFSHVDVLERCE